MFEAATPLRNVQVSALNTTCTLCIFRVDEHRMAVELNSLLNVQEGLPPNTTATVLSATAPKYFVRLALPDGCTAWLGITGIGDVIEVPHHALRRLPRVLETIEPRLPLLAFAWLDDAWLPILDAAQLGRETQDV